MSHNILYNEYSLNSSNSYFTHMAQKLYNCTQILQYKILSLWAVSDRKHGGLNFSTDDIGEVLAMAGTPYLCLLSSTYIQNVKVTLG